ncbi:PH domain-containing protein [Candidatus Woesearchaeota archaeon]|nr:PH domain-containing protein [Candidatus Woesearchaeota archaeon]
MVLQIQIIVGGIVFNFLLIGIYFLLHHEIEKFEAVKEKILLTVKRARRSYFLSYAVVLIFVSATFFTKGQLRLVFIFVSLAALIFLEILHDSKRLVLTENQTIIVKGFISYRASLVEYKDIILVEVKDDILGRVLGYGDIIINVYGAKEYSLEKIPNFLKVKNIIEEGKLRPVVQVRGS